MQEPDLILGTALWGWTIDRTTCFQLLDTFYRAGYRQIDCATNYPINNNTLDFRRAESILLEWISTNQIEDLRIIHKIGSLNNMGGPENNLSRSFLLLNLEDYREHFGLNFQTFMIHWDNRDSKEAIHESLEVLQLAQNAGVSPGLSGIRHPEIYAELNKEFRLPFRIEIKHNLLQSAYPHYESLSKEAEFLTYGINAGGLKLKPAYHKNSSATVRNIKLGAMDSIREELKLIMENSQNTNRKKLTHFYQIGMLYSYYLQGVSGILVGPSNTNQLLESIRFLELIKVTDYQDIYQNLIALEGQA